MLIKSVDTVKASQGSALQPCFQRTAEECQGSGWWAGRCGLCACVNVVTTLKSVAT